LGIPSRDIESWIREQKKRGAHIIPMGDKIASLQKTITAQMDYKDAILRQIEQCRFALMYGMTPFKINVIMLLNMTPEKLRDEQFKEDIKNAKVTIIVKTGKRRHTTWYSTRKEIYSEGWTTDYFALFRACINLFDRRGMFWSETQVEVI